MHPNLFKVRVVDDLGGTLFNGNVANLEIVELRLVDLREDRLVV